MSKKFTWLHLSDLHVGLKDQEWMWPTFKHLFFEDIQKLLKKIGNIDCVIFSGDLTQKADENEFNRLTEILNEIWQEFEILGIKPSLFLVPGNHDLVRPQPEEPEVIALTNSWHSSILQNAFWKADSQYLETIKKAFSNFTNWKLSLATNGIPLLNDFQGIIPGDASIRFECSSGLNIGLIGLNTPWLHLCEGDFKGRLHIDPRQLLEVTESDPTTWCKNNDINLLITHHPIDWITRESLITFNSEIFPPGRFDAHLYGHMHEPQTAVVSLNGSDPKTHIQAASIFGLHSLNGGGNNRIHGYSICQINVEDEIKSFSFWPRIARVLPDGSRSLGVDMNFKVNEDNCVIVTLPKSRKNILEVKKEPAHTSDALAIAKYSDSETVLKRVKVNLSQAKEHLEVRRVEQAKSLAIFRNSRALWLISEWGMDSDSFVWTIQSRLDQTNLNTYKVNLQSYKSRNDFLDYMLKELHCSFEQFCELLSLDGNSYLILDDIPNGQYTFDSFARIENDVEEMVEAILQYCPNVKVILRSRKLPESVKFSIVELKAFEEPDIKAYVTSHRLGGSSIATEQTIERLFRYTDGVPSRIDSALKELGFIHLNDLASINKDITGKDDSESFEAPQPLVKAVQSLMKSDDPALLRAFELLKVLTIFPQGEEFTRIKRFNGPYPFYPKDAIELIERALVETSGNVQLGSLLNLGDSQKILIVARPVREYVHSLLKDNELDKLNQTAITLYFGTNSLSGTIKSPADLRFDDPKRTNAEISNASVILQRMIHGAILSSASSRKIKKCLQIATYFISSLESGHHYRSGVAFGNDFLPLVPDKGFEAELSYIEYRFAKCLRMMGESKQAKDLFTKTLNLGVDKSLNQIICLELAYCHETLGEHDDAVKMAQESKKLDKKSNASLQAEAMICDNDKTDPERITKLKKLESLCRKRGAILTANNIVLKLSNELENSPQLREQLTSIRALSLTRKETYTMVRATVDLSALILDAGLKLNSKEESNLIDAYHYLFNERMPGLFNKCNEALWDHFKSHDEVPNLLRLFRHSSLIWRLRGNDSQEEKFAQKLVSSLTHRLSDYKDVRRETHYFVARAQSFKQIDLKDISLNENLID